jgi:hypothetical protein
MSTKHNKAPELRQLNTLYAIHIMYSSGAADNRAGRQGTTNHRSLVVLVVRQISGHMQFIWLVRLQLPSVD